MNSTNALQQSENLLKQEDTSAQNITSHLAAETTINLQERIIAEQKARIEDNAANAVLLAELRDALDLERKKNIQVEVKPKGKLAVLESVISYCNKQSRIAVTQTFWIVVGFLFGSAAPAFYKANLNAVWTAGFMTIYIGFIVFIMLQVARYAYRKLRNAYESGPLAFCNLLFAYGTVAAFAGIMEQVTSWNVPGDHQMIWMIFTGFATAACSFLYGRTKAKEGGVRFPDLRVAGHFM